MALGTITSVGIGSGVLTQDVLDKLKAADTKVQVDPITKNIESNLTKQKDLSAIKTLVSSFKLSASSLSDETMYLKRNTSATGTSATLVADTGVNVQDFDIDVKQLAQRDVYQSSKFTSAESLIGKSGSFILNYRGVEEKIEVKASTSYEELASIINEKTNGEVQAKILNVGGNKPYQLIVQSRDMGADNFIKFSNQDSNGNVLSGADDILAQLGWDSANVDSNKISTAQDAEFTYNGVTVKRASNNIKDLSVGLNLTLKETGKTSFKVTEDTSAIKEEMQNLVKAYNSLVNNLSVATDYNQETGNAGTFQGVSEITSIKSSINKILFESKNISGKNMSLTDFGLELSEDGLLKLNSSTLDSKLNQNLSEVKSFFAGSTTYSQIQTSSSKNIESGAITVANNDFTINGIEITLDTPATNSAKENAIALLEAINKAGITGIQAALNSSEDRIILKSGEGASIEIKGNASILDKFGLTAVNISSKKTVTQGVFSSLNSRLNDMVGKDGSLTLFSEKLTGDNKKLTEERAKATESLTTKYDMMAQRFLAYDKMIANLENQFSTLKSMIDAEMNSKK